MDTDVDTLSSRIRSARISSGLSQTDLAKALSVNRATVGHWEREESFSPTIDHLQRMSRIMNVSVSWLVVGEQIKPAGETVGTRSSLEARLVELSKHLPMSFLLHLLALMESAETYI